MNLEALAKRVDRLESIEEIKQLKARYCDYCDKHYDPEGLAGLFAEDGVWEGGERFGRHVGREAIKAFFARVSQEITFAVHMVVDPIIEVKGNKATGQWYVIMPATLRAKQAAWLLGRYDEEYVRVKGRWLYKRLKADIMCFSPYEEGWAKKPFMG